MAMPRRFKSFSNIEKHICQIIEEFAHSNDERVRSTKIHGKVDYDEFNAADISRALQALEHKGYIKQEGDFIVRTWQ